MTAESTVERVTRTASWRQAFIAAHGVRCHYCNRPGSPDIGPGDRPWHIDHMDPLAKGGLDDETNLTLACKRCNLVKGVQPYRTFVKYARSAYWTPTDDSVDTGELDLLMRLWERGADGRLWVSIPDEGDVAVIDAEPLDGPAGTSAVPIFTGSDYRGTSRWTAEFLVAAHRLVPQLVAEIKLLREEARA